MQEEIVILNILKYSNEKGSGCRLAFYFSSEDKISDTDKFLGYTEVTQFYSVDVYDKFDKSIIGIPVKATIETKSSSRNPLQTRQVVTSIETDKDVISLV